jgi:cell division initiation protein
VRVSPLDIRKQIFKKVMRGADPEEVRMFLDVVASEYEKAIQDNAMMAERIRTLEARVAEFRALEENMRNSLVMADRIATESRESSDREARRIIQDAHSRSERILEDARERLQVLVREIETLRGKKEVFARRFWTMIEGQIGVLQDHMADTVEVESLRQRVAQMAADARSAAEAAAEEPPARPAPSARPAHRVEADGAVGYRADSERQAAHRPEPDPAPAFRGGSHEAPAAPTPRGSVPRPDTGPRPEPVTRAADALPRVSDSSAARVTDPAARRPIPRGLGRLLRGRQSNLPMNGPAPAAETALPRPLPAGEDLPEPERVEGFFEISASDARRRESSPRFREDEAGDRS